MARTSALGIVLLLAPLLASAGDVTPTYVFDRMWPTLQQPWYFNRPTGVAVDRAGNVFVADRLLHRIRKFNADGVFIRQWGKLGGAPDDFSAPHGLAVGPFGYVFVADSFHDRIQKFTADGELVTLWGVDGEGDGEFDVPKAVALDTSGNVYVCDTNNDRIQVFTHDGDFIRKWGQTGSGPGDFAGPTGIVVGPTGRVYVADTENDRVQVFTASGALLDIIGGRGSAPGEFLGPVGLTFDETGFLYVADDGNHRIQKLTGEGTYVQSWGTFGTGSDEFLALYGLAASRDGSLYTAHVQPDRVQKFTQDGVFLATWANAGEGLGQLELPNSVAVDPSGGFVYVTDSGNQRIQQFTTDGVFVRAWGRRGSGPGEFDVIIGLPWGLAVDGAGIVYVTDAENHRIQKFDAAGAYLGEWGEAGTGPGQFGTAGGIAISGSGDVYVSDTALGRIQRFTSDGTFVSMWGTGIGPVSLHAPRGLAVDSTGDVYVADYTGKKVYKFSGSGDLLWTLEANKGGVDFSLPLGVALDSAGRIYVTDVILDHVQVFSPDGALLSVIGDEGSAPGFFSEPNGIAIDSTDAIYIVEERNNRVQKLRPVTLAPDARAIVVAGGGVFPGNNLWDATQYCANFAMRALVHQGFTNDTIYYLSYDTGLDLNGNGEADDVDASLSNANLEHAITTWAQGAEELVIYLVDHGGANTFRMSGLETLDVADLADWIDAVDPSIAGAITVVYDACQSGSFVDALSGPGRIIATSAAADEYAYFMSTGTVSFSNFFWTQIFNGFSVGDAFDTAATSLAQSIALQTPQLADNGLADTTFLGNGAAVNRGAPVIADVSPPQDLADESAAGLFADVEDSDGVARVWAVITPPAFALPTANNAVLALPSVELIPTAAKGAAERWEAMYTGFASEGTYTVAFYARDMIGNTSLPTVTSVTVNDPLRRRAVLVAGGGTNDPLWPGIERAVLSAYRALKTQGYTDDDIYFLSPAAISAGVDGSNSLGNLSFAMTNWAQDEVRDVIVYLAGPGNAQSFALNSTRFVQKEQFASWFNAIQAAIPGRIVFVYDGPQSGAFIPALSAPGTNRVLISSTASDGQAAFLSGGDVSFSTYFWIRALNGATVDQAYRHALSAMRLSTGQLAQIDDNGNGIANEAADGAIARNVVIGAGVLLAGDDPVIASIDPGSELGPGASAVIGVTGVTSTSAIAAVAAQIRHVPSQTVDSLPLVPGPGGRYEATYDGFGGDGGYYVSVIAVDTQGNVSEPIDTRYFRNYLFDPSDNGVWDSVDIQLVINRALGLSGTGATDLNGDNATDAIDVQLAINTVLGLE